MIVHRCDKQLPKRFDMRWHVAHHHMEDIPAVKCDHCDFKTRFWYGLKMHIRVRHSQAHDGNEIILSSFLAKSSG